MPPPCALERENLQACRLSLDLADPRACYPASYDGRCDGLEQQLKRCLAFALCSRRDAATFYDATRPRPARVEANRSLQACLARKKALLPCR